MGIWILPTTKADLLSKWKTLFSCLNKQYIISKCNFKISLGNLFCECMFGNTNPQARSPFVILKPELQWKLFLTYNELRMFTSIPLCDTWQNSNAELSGTLSRSTYSIWCVKRYLCPLTFDAPSKILKMNWILLVVVGHCQAYAREGYAIHPCARVTSLYLYMWQFFKFFFEFPANIGLHNKSIGKHIS